jgi:hypothetical protein
VTDLETTLQKWAAEIETLRAEIEEGKTNLYEAEQKLTKCEESTKMFEHIAEAAQADNVELRDELYRLRALFWTAALCQWCGKSTNHRAAIYCSDDCARCDRGRAVAGAAPPIPPPEPGCKRCGKPLAYDGAIYCGAACAARSGA